MLVHTVPFGTVVFPSQLDTVFGTAVTLHGLSGTHTGADAWSHFQSLHVWVVFSHRNPGLAVYVHVVPLATDDSVQLVIAFGRTGVVHEANLMQLVGLPDHDPSDMHVRAGFEHDL